MPRHRQSEAGIFNHSQEACIPSLIYTEKPGQLSSKPRFGASRTGQHVIAIQQPVLLPTPTGGLGTKPHVRRNDGPAGTQHFHRLLLGEWSLACGRATRPRLPASRTDIISTARGAGVWKKLAAKILLNK